MCFVVRFPAHTYWWACTAYVNMAELANSYFPSKRLKQLTISVTRKHQTSNDKNHPLHPLNNSARVLFLYSLSRKEVWRLAESRRLRHGNRWDSNTLIKKENTVCPLQVCNPSPLLTSSLYVNYPHWTWNILHRGSSHVGGLRQLISRWAHDE